ncbi:pre-mRNA 3' end processing protein WDR33 isoform X5 [Artibeus jamaicensis]|uniref:pre-mRNA 3' end processing protein WDR33 isoform X5 n=1 Tax=Artibeus jamaicensis TaxID=9417 RepID=UPI00235A837D|nr:pre-mRNA 3' end processing protein WDR33 isoform X5 [Artibeus jamaicensis]
MATEIGSPPRFFHMPRFQHQAPRQLFYKRPDFAQQQAMQQLTFDGKRMRKAVNRKTIDYNPSVIKYLENRIWQRDQRDMRAIQPDAGYYNDLVPPIGMLNNPMNAVTTKFVRTSTNKVKCPVFVVRWTPEGRRLVTGASSGEFTLWNGLTFNFETILQAHDSPVRAMTWSHNDMWMLTADHGGYVKYWQSNMNNVKMFQAHKEAIREASFSPTDNKFATCSDDGTVRIWDFLRCHEERILRGTKPMGIALTRNQTRDLLLCVRTPNQLSHTCQGEFCFLCGGSFYFKFFLWKFQTCSKVSCICLYLKDLCYSLFVFFLF